MECATATVPTLLVPAWAFWPFGGRELVPLDVSGDRAGVERGENPGWVRGRPGGRRPEGPVPGLATWLSPQSPTGSYEQLWGGAVADALVDLTGGLAGRWNLKDVAGSRWPAGQAPRHGHRTYRQLLQLEGPLIC